MQGGSASVSLTGRNWALECQRRQGQSSTVSGLAMKHVKQGRRFILYILCSLAIGAHGNIT